MLFWPFWQKPTVKRRLFADLSVDILDNGGQIDLVHKKVQSPYVHLQIESSININVEKL